ncbi:hypothetical protein BJV74DRAFT_885003 [Russula compacta]|nr:hypothetical protein BJV74DRAFT_885003 [Russula compacta]
MSSPAPVPVLAPHAAVEEASRIEVEAIGAPPSAMASPSRPLRQLAVGLASTLQQRKALFQDEVRCLKHQFEDVNCDNRELKARIQQIDGEPLLCPDRYIDNNGRLPEFTITTPDGEKPAIFIKQLDDGRVARLAANATGDHDAQIIKLYVRPEFDDFPLSPLPLGSEAVIDLDDWPLLTEVTRYWVLDRECDTLRAELHLAQANLAASEAAKQACEDRLIAARAAKKVPAVGVERFRPQLGRRLFSGSQFILYPTNMPSGKKSTLLNGAVDMRTPQQKAADTRKANKAAKEKWAQELQQDFEEQGMKHTVPKLAADGSNWVIYRDRMLWVLDTNSLKDHLQHDSMPTSYTTTSTIGSLTPEQ